MKSNKLNFNTTKDIKIPLTLCDQIIGQDNAVNIIKKVANQRRNLLLIGNPGVGKSMVGQALAELLPKEKLKDILAYPNQADENIPKIRVVPKGQGKKIITKTKLQSLSSLRGQNLILIILLIIATLTPWWIRKEYGDIMAAASLITSVFFIVAIMFLFSLGKRMKLPSQKTESPKLLIDNSKTKKAPFLDGTGAHSGALLGDVLHDPLQTFSPDTTVMTKTKKKISLNKLLDPLFKKHKNNLIKKGEYEAFFTNKNELSILADKNNNLKNMEVLSANRYPYKGKLIKLTTQSGKTIIITPEHKVAVNNKGKKQYMEASKLKKGQIVFVKK